MDEIFGLIYRQFGAPPNWSRPPGFESLLKIILEQQVSLASANAHFLKLKNFLGDLNPTTVLSVDDHQMRACQISRQKTKYLRALSKSVLDGDIDLENMSEMDELLIRSGLTAITGIGVWTSDIYLMFCLQKKDVFPIGDIAVVNTVKELTGVGTREEILILSESWRPLRSLATYFFWHYYLKKRNRTVA
jgi:DNA-3-methyladenine glycosylase II